MPTHKTTTLSFTGIMIQDPNDKEYTAYFAEFPEVIAEGATFEEAKYNLFEAFKIMLEVKKQEFQKDINFNMSSKVENFQLELA